MSLCSTLRIGPEPEGNFYSRVEGKSFDHGIKNSLVSLSLSHSFKSFSWYKFILKL